MPDLNDFLGKIDLEGGVDEALDYGLKVDKYDLPDNVRDAWTALRALRDEYEAKRADMLAVIETAMEEAGYE